ncbi:cytochrome c oxidase subunit II [Pleurocapsa sp. FMAR1]|uniref:cytochrome c oxidase subunit II n=1 Tax=Pleurocapsa sp. FMAR1 TaxID=3040204 RepID=UPI0029C97988|nr:cytochrome c oxidase subunit II [Pleurocapsa sp. FMAR1]
MTKIFEYILMAVGMVVIIVVSYWLGQTSYSWMPIEASTDAKYIDDLFSFLVTMASVIFLGVMGMLIYSLIFYRAESGDYTEGHAYRHNWKLEVVWLVVPTALVLWIGVYSFNIYTRMEISGPKKLLASTAEPAYMEVVDRDNTNGSTATIGVVAKQWAWDFHYPNQKTTHELHLPVNQRVRLMLQSEDVLHGFYVPEFRIKQDIIPTRDIAFQFVPTRVGKYKLHDSQLSGTYFAINEADVYVDTAEDYQKWLAEVTADISDFNLAATEYTNSQKRAFNSHYPTVIPAQSSQIALENNSAEIAN